MFIIIISNKRSLKSRAEMYNFRVLFYFFYICEVHTCTLLTLDGYKPEQRIKLL